MRVQPLLRPLTADEFLQIEFPDWFKAELVDGEIVAMAGGTKRHAQVQGNVYFGLRLRLRGTNCQPFGPDFAVRTPDGNVRYPDVSVVCGQESGDDGEKATTEPVVIIEVLSPSTARRDATEKLLEYKAIPSVRSVVLIDPDAETIRLVQRTDDGWMERLIGDELPLTTLDLTLPRAEIFARD